MDFASMGEGEYGSLLRAVKDWMAKNARQFVYVHSAHCALAPTGNTRLQTPQLSIGVSADRLGKCSVCFRTERTSRADTRSALILHRKDVGDCQLADRGRAGLVQHL
jgi:hypothetical protein